MSSNLSHLIMPVTFVTGVENGTKKQYGGVASGFCHARSFDLECEQFVSGQSCFEVAPCGFDILFCVLRRQRHSERTFDGFVLRFLFFDCWTPLVASK